MRVLSLTPSFTEILQALGRSDYLIDSPEMRPDIVLAEVNENRADEIRKLREKFQVKVFDVRSLEAVADAVAELGRLLDAGPAAKQLNESIEAERRQNRAVFSPKPPVKTIILFWHQPYLTVNFDTYPCRLLEASGAVNVFRKESLREFPVELEDMIEKGPECLILPSGPFCFTKRHIEGFRRYRIFSKIRIELLDGRLFSRYGPRTAEALKTLRKLYENYENKK